MTMKNFLFGLLRIAMGWTFLWPFLDKVWGLGFTTTVENAWINGGSPTTGFLKFATLGPFAGFYQNLAGSAYVDFIFMLGLLLIGLALILGIGVRIAAYFGAILLLLMFTAGFIPPEHNPILDEHVIYLLTLLVLAGSDVGRFLGLGGVWQRTSLVSRHPILK